MHYDITLHFSEVEVHQVSQPILLGSNISYKIRMRDSNKRIEIGVSGV